jgi:hypothetical protein
MRLRYDRGCTYRSLLSQNGMRPARRRAPMRLRRLLPIWRGGEAERINREANDRLAIERTDERRITRWAQR